MFHGHCITSTVVLSGTSMPPNRKVCVNLVVPLDWSLFGVRTLSSDAPALAHGFARVTCKLKPVAETLEIGIS